MHRFYSERKIIDQSFVIDNAEQVRQILKVLRLSDGDRIALFDNSGSDFEMEIVQPEKNSISLKLIAKRPGIIFDRHIILYQALLKKDNLEWVAQKATELGVSKIVPILTKRVVKNDLSRQGVTRLMQIIVEATEQSGGSVVPELGALISFADALKGIDKNHINLIAHEQEKERQATAAELASDDISIFIGPEGGFDPAEYQTAIESGIIGVSLGKRVLRAETAAIASLAKILL